MYGTKYTIGAEYNFAATKSEQLHQQLVSLDIFMFVTASFSTKYLDIYTAGSYPYPLQRETSALLINELLANTAQLCNLVSNYRLPCEYDHLHGHCNFALDTRSLFQSIFRFHVYYQTRKIFHQMNSALPTE